MLTTQGFNNMAELTKDGKPRKRAEGAGRPRKHGEPTKSVRIPQSVPVELVSSIPELQAILDHWESECAKNKSSARHYFLSQALDEIRRLGF